MLIVVQGGPGTLKTVLESIREKIPILVLAVSVIVFIFVGKIGKKEPNLIFDQREVMDALI